MIEETPREMIVKVLEAIDNGYYVFYCNHDHDRMAHLSSMDDILFVSTERPGTNRVELPLREVGEYHVRFEGLCFCAKETTFNFEFANFTIEEVRGMTAREQP